MDVLDQRTRPKDLVLEALLAISNRDQARDSVGLAPKRHENESATMATILNIISCR